MYFTHTTFKKYILKSKRAEQNARKLLDSKQVTIHQFQMIVRQINNVFLGDLEAILDAILKISLFQWQDLGKLLICY